MRRIALVCFALCALTFGVTNSVAAQDADCGDFATPAEAQAYFEAGGGSASYNYNNLDGDGDGLACENYGYSGGGTSAGTDVTSPIADDGEDASAAEALPTTGSGPVADTSTSIAPILGISAVLLAGVSLVLRRTTTGRM